MVFNLLWNMKVQTGGQCRKTVDKLDHYWEPLKILGIKMAKKISAEPSYEPMSQELQGIIRSLKAYLGSVLDGCYAFEAVDKVQVSLRS